MRTSLKSIVTILITSCLLGGLPQAGSATTLQITGGGFSANNTNDFQANGSVSGPGFSISVAGNAVTCGPCATLFPPPGVTPFFSGMANLSTFMSFGARPGTPFGPEFDGVLHVSAQTVVVTNGNASSPFTLSGTLTQQRPVGPQGTFDVTGSGTEVVTSSGSVSTIGLSFQAVPEPSTWLLVASGLITLLFVKQRLLS